MSSYVAASLRRLVESRANGICEYCLIHERDTFLGCQVDHIISEKHGGPTEADNLAYACVFCNRAKGSDISSIAPASGEIVRLYNPRIDRWSDHFSLRGAVIEARSPVGEATIQALRFNTTERLMERRSLVRLGRFPPPEAETVLSPPQK